MSFFKKIKAELREMLNDDDEKDKKNDQGADHTKDVYTQPGQNMYPQGQPPQPYPSYGGPPPPGGQLPPGWISQWDQNSQRYYYVEQATGRTQWEPPMWQGGPPPPPAGGPGYYQAYGQAMPPVPYQQGHDEHQRAYYGDIQQKEQKGGSGMGTVVAAGIGGAAVGALAAHALGDSDDETHTAAPVSSGYGAPPPGPPEAAPVPLEDNPNVSSSQRESLEEAREDYEEAQRQVDEEGSSASSSDLEELQEAREEYLSEAGSAQEELDE